MAKTRVDYRFTDTTLKLLEELKVRLDKTETAVVEDAIRKLNEETRKDKAMTQTFNKSYPEIEGFQGYKMDDNGVMGFFYRGYQEPGIVGFDHDPIFDYIGHHIPRILENTASGKPLSEKEGLDKYNQPNEGVSEWPRHDPLFDMAPGSEIELAGHHIKKTSWTRNGIYHESFFVTKA